MDEGPLIRLIGELAAAIPGGWYVQDVQTGAVVPPGRQGGYGHRITLMETPLSWSELKAGMMHRADVFLISPHGPPAGAPATAATPTTARATGPASAPAPLPATELAPWGGGRVFFWQDAKYAWPKAEAAVVAALRAADSPAAPSTSSGQAPSIGSWRSSSTQAAPAGLPKVMVGHVTLYWPKAKPDSRLEQLVDFHTFGFFADGGSEANVPLHIRGWHMVGPCWIGEGLYAACFRGTAAVALVPLARLREPSPLPFPSVPPAIELWDVPTEQLLLAVWEDGTVLRRPRGKGTSWEANYVHLGWVRPAALRKWQEKAGGDGAMTLPIDAAIGDGRQRRMAIRIAGRQKVLESGVEEARWPKGMDLQEQIWVRRLFAKVWSNAEYGLRVFEVPEDRVYPGPLAIQMPLLTEELPPWPSTASGPSLRAALARMGRFPLWDPNETVADYATRVGIPRTDLDLELSEGVSMRLTLIPPGRFRMGSPPEEANRRAGENPPHEVILRKPFFLGQTEVTRGQFAAFVTDANYRSTAEKEGWAWGWSGRSFANVKGASWRQPGFEQTDRDPVTEVSLDDAVAFCDWLTVLSGLKVRLPTEAEWEYACRAGSAAAYAWGDDPNGGAGRCNAADRSTAGKAVIDGPAFDWDDGQVFTAPANSFKPNAWGLFDMHGNVWEWCADWYDEFYYYTAEAAGENPPGSPFGPMRVLRGGGWRSGPPDCRAARRLPAEQDLRRFDIGFRVMVEIRSTVGIAAALSATMPARTSTTMPATRPASSTSPAGTQPADLTGTVTAVKGDIAAISIGSAKGVKKGMVAVVSRGAKTICEIQIEEVDINQSAGIITKKTENPEQGDKVTISGGK